MDCLLVMSYYNIRCIHPAYEGLFCLGSYISLLEILLQICQSILGNKHYCIPQFPVKNIFKRILKYDKNRFQLILFTTCHGELFHT